MSSCQRNFNIDFLRWFGLTLIVLAHVNAPFTVTQLRCFDVPLMVFVSGICFKYPKVPILSYLWQRFKRLYIPTFIFLFIFFILIYAAKKLGVTVPYTTAQVIGSFLLLENPSIGYVWIIRVFILMAILAPLVYNITQKLNNISYFFVSSAILIALALAEYFIDTNDSVVFNFIIVELLYYAIGYGIILSLSFRLKNDKNRIFNKLKYLSYSILIIYALCVAISGEMLPISNKFKYPPQLIYILYGISVSVLLYGFDFARYINGKIKRVITYISEHSLWVYLWHIPLVVFFNSFIRFDGLWWLKWIGCYTGAIFVTYIQVLIIMYVQEKHPSVKSWTKYLVS